MWSLTNKQTNSQRTDWRLQEAQGMGWTKCLKVVKRHKFPVIG